MALALAIGKCTLLGNYRENNEDAIDVKQFPDMTVCLVADGMGGQAAGEVASKRARSSTGTFEHPRPRPCR